MASQEKKPRSRYLDYAVYVTVRFLVMVVQLLPWAVVLPLARGAAWLVHRLDRRHRLVAEENVRRAFPDLSADEVDRLVRASYRHIVTSVVEVLKLPRLVRPDNVTDYINYAIEEEYHEAAGWFRSDRPILSMTGHFGNWEVMSYVSGMMGFGGNIIARRLDNPYLDDYLTKYRQKTGQRILDKNRDYDKMIQSMADGQGLGLVGDQDAGPRGVFVDFLGRPASTFKSIALLSLQYSAPILIVGAARVGGPMQYRVYLEDIIFPEEYANDPNAVRAITQRFTTALERLVRRHPEQYFWVHRRWKSQPKPRARKLAA